MKRCSARSLFAAHCSVGIDLSRSRLAREHPLLLLLLGPVFFSSSRPNNNASRSQHKTEQFHLTRPDLEAKLNVDVLQSLFAHCVAFIYVSNSIFECERQKGENGNYAKQGDRMKRFNWILTYLNAAIGCQGECYWRCVCVCVCLFASPADNNNFIEINSRRAAALRPIDERYSVFFCCLLKWRVNRIDKKRRKSEMRKIRLHSKGRNCSRDDARWAKGKWKRKCVTSTENSVLLLFPSLSLLFAVHFSLENLYTFRFSLAYSFFLFSHLLPNFLCQLSGMRNWNSHAT